MNFETLHGEISLWDTTFLLLLLLRKTASVVNISRYGILVWARERVRGE